MPAGSEGQASNPISKIPAKLSATARAISLAAALAKLDVDGRADYFAALDTSASSARSLSQTTLVGR